MTTFLQFHLLTAYPPSNPNRDDQGRPKSAMVGGAPRLRLSSQSIKRAARQSAAFQADLAGHLGQRTKQMGRELIELAESLGANQDSARELSANIIRVFGKLEKTEKGESKNTDTGALAFISPDERTAMEEWVKLALSGTELPDRNDLKDKILRKADAAADIAMFGRMLAGEEKFNIADFGREAAVQVGHAITTHTAQVEDDFYTAVDDLKKPNQDLGAGMMGELPFGSGIYYLYACVNCDLLAENLAWDTELAATSAQALATALATAAPTGKQNSHAHHPRAAYIRAELGSAQPRDLTGAFFEPVAPKLTASIDALEQMVDKLDKAYGAAADDVCIMNVDAGEGTLEEIRAFARQAVARVQVPVAV